MAGAVAGHGGRTDHYRLDRHGCRLAVRPEHHPGPADRRHRRLHRCRGGVLAARRQGPERAGYGNPRDRIGEQRSDGGVPHRDPDRHDCQRPDRPALEPADSPAARVRHRRPAGPGWRLADAATGQPHQPRWRPLSDPGGGRRPGSVLADQRPARQRLPRRVPVRPGAGQPADPQPPWHPAHARRHGLAGADRHVPGPRPAGDASRPAADRIAGAGPGAVDDHLCPATVGGRQPAAVQGLPWPRKSLYLLGWPARRGTDHSCGVPADGRAARCPAVLQPGVLYRAGLAAGAGHQPAVDGQAAQSHRTARPCAHLPFGPGSPYHQ
ncbi:hypothetical protein D3C77_447610 [compost metagenome]